ncbi:helix-turn-helix domain-containing protein [Ferrimicrobium sp.]|uniref:helix-turn-helix domain-containing protein n=1 Tax=Ferrimicrobium sp. TaxID=2926050 RepID=UPI00344B9133
MAAVHIDSRKQVRAEDVVGPAVAGWADQKKREDRDAEHATYRYGQNEQQSLGDGFPPILNSREAAEMLRCGVTHIQALARDGVIPANRSPGGRWRFSRDALILWTTGVQPGGSRC